MMMGEYITTLRLYGITYEKIFMKSKRLYRDEADIRSDFRIVSKGGRKFKLQKLEPQGRLWWKKQVWEDVRFHLLCGDLEPLEFDSLRDAEEELGGIVNTLLMEIPPWVPVPTKDTKGLEVV